MKVLFVCMGNICRSPTAEGVFRKMVESSPLAGKVDIDSAATHGYHEGSPPDPRYEVPDPYHGKPVDFETALDLIEAGCEGLHEYLQEQLTMRGSLSGSAKD